MESKTEYMFSYRDAEGDLCETADNLTYEEFKSLAKEVRAEGGKIVETWKYVDGEFKGRPTA